MRAIKTPVPIRSLLVALGLAGATSGFAATATYDFNSDPTADLEIGGNNPEVWRDNGGNPGGFLAITWPVGNQYTGVVFPDIDPGMIVTAFNFKCDLRIGNGTTDRPADGF